MVVLAKPDPSDMVQEIEKAIHLLPQIDPQATHFRLDVDIEVVPDIMHFRHGDPPEDFNKDNA
ncbi:hypothetical protein LguiA_004364 [Lonicera macranthoides]